MRAGPDPSDPRSAVFQFCDQLNVYGGLVGDEVRSGSGHIFNPPNENEDDRDFVAHPTILSGDIGVLGNTSDNCYCVVLFETVNYYKPTQLDGFSITGGNGGYSSNNGGGIYVKQSIKPTIANCRISQCEVTGNNQYEGNGGGMYVEDGVVKILNTSFSDCKARQGAGLSLAGYGEQNVLEYCDFVRNTATTNSGAIHNYWNVQARIDNCRFLTNTAPTGAAVRNEVYSNVVFKNCLFSGGKSRDNGAAVWNGGSMIFTNCTVASNTCEDGHGGGIFHYSGYATVVNSIFWNNRDVDTPPLTQPDESAQIDKVSWVNCAVTYTCIQGKTNFDDPTNTDANPQFRSLIGFDGIPGTEDDDLRLAGSPLSPCVDVGDNAMMNLTQDVETLTRFVDGDGNYEGTENVTVDMGAYEFQGVIFDCNHNNIEDAIDIANCPENDLSCQDCNENDVPDECDIGYDTSHDCNMNGIPDDCEGLWPDCNGNCISDATELDENGDTIPDECQFAVPGHWSQEDDFAVEPGDFAVRINVSNDVSGSLVRNPATETEPLPYLWVAASSRATIVRINTDTGEIEGEYHTAPEHHGGDNQTDIASNPSRTTVDLDGSLWASNRGDNSQIHGEGPTLGSVVKIGLIIGGQRVNDAEIPDANGEYVKDPDYCNCEDRNGDGLIHTSRGLGDILPWENLDGADDGGGVSQAEDECLLRYVRTEGTGMRTVAIDKQNNVWVGGRDVPQKHQKLDGFTGSTLVSAFSAYGGGYGGFVDCNGVLWSARGDDSTNKQLVRYNTLSGNILGTIGWSGGNYGLAYDGLTGKVWYTFETSGTIAKYNQDGSWVGTYSHTNNYDFWAQGAAVDCNNNVWVAHSHAGSGATTVGRLKTNGTGGRSVPLVYTDPFNVQYQGVGPTGVAVDRNGKIWVVNDQSNDVMRITPTVDQNGTEGETVDLRVDLGTGAGAYNYSDMTGMVGLHTSGMGTWTVIHDGQRPGQFWCQVRWNEGNCITPPESGDILVEVRAADRKTSLAAIAYTQVQYNAIQHRYEPLQDIQGRFVQVRVRLKGSCAGTEYYSPSLCNLRVVPTMDCTKGDVNFDRNIDGLDIQSFVDVLLSNPNSVGLAKLCAADMNYNGEAEVGDIPCFVEKLLIGTSSCENLFVCDGEGFMARGFTMQGGSLQPSGDCNQNGIPDANDIADGISQDCNRNFIPDECDINPSDPDNNGMVSNDLNGNGIPDECEPDCNANGIPDNKDIADQTSHDINSNGIPDECEPDCNANAVPDAWDVDPLDPDGNGLVSADCNGNGHPDECERDCNGNGVPDDCDVNPLDLDGDGIVWPDCNNNRNPDACDFNFPPPLGSTDCNENGTPDECDIANCSPENPSCQDCNGNGFPDSCDIAAQISLDENTNGIPDECEGESLLMGGESMMSEGMMFGDTGCNQPFGAGPTLNQAARDAYFDWVIQQDWGLDSELSGAEQFQLMVAKMQELGLPVKNARR